MRLAFALSALFWVLVAASVIERPPPQFERCAHTATVRIVPNPNWTCREDYGMRLWPGRVFLACYDPPSNTIVMPRDDGGKWWQELLAHEAAHECGWRHPSEQ